MNTGSISSDLASLQDRLANRFDTSAAQYSKFAGIVGDRPSRYAKSPTLWNAAFKALDLNAVFLPFDVDKSALPSVVETLRRSESLLGCSVTVPYKIEILDLLDEVDDQARRIGAVNTVRRDPDGRLIGFNTDGSGFVATLKSTVVEPPLFEELSGLDVLLVGAGGAARAVAFYLAEEIGPGRLFIANRTQAKAAALASAVDDAYGNATAIGADEVEDVAARVRLIVNSSTRGQAGFRTLDDGAVTTLEPYSALAPAQPTNVPVDSDPESGTALQQWFEASLPDILRNNEKSLRIAGRVAASVPAYDLVYAPTETVFMRHFRYSGHRVVNGKGMNVAQAVDGFCDRVCGDYLKTHGLDGGAVRDRVAQEMIRVW